MWLQDLSLLYEEKLTTEGNAKDVAAFVQHDEKWRKVEWWTDGHVNLQVGSDYFKMCYRKQCNGAEEERAKKSKVKETKSKVKDGMFDMQGIDM